MTPQFTKGQTVRVTEQLQACTEFGEHRLHTILPTERLAVVSHQAGEFMVEVCRGDGNPMRVARGLIEPFAD